MPIRRVGGVSDEAFNELYESALERVEKMSYLEFMQHTNLEDYRALTHIEDRIAHAMAEEFIQTGEWSSGSNSRNDG